MPTKNSSYLKLCINSTDLFFGKMFNFGILSHNRLNFVFHTNSAILNTTITFEISITELLFYTIMSITYYNARSLIFYSSDDITRSSLTSLICIATSLIKSSFLVPFALNLTFFITSHFVRVATFCLEICNNKRHSS